MMREMSPRAQARTSARSTNLSTETLGGGSRGGPGGSRTDNVAQRGQTRTLMRGSAGVKDLNRRHAGPPSRLREVGDKVSLYSRV